MTKEKVDDVKPVIPDPEAVETPPEGYSAEDWQDLSPTEKEGILSGLNEDEEGEQTDDIDEATLTAIAGEEETQKEEKPKKEAKPKEEAPKGEKPVEEKPKEEKVVTTEVKPSEEKLPAEVKPEEVPTGVLSDEELVKFRPHVSDAELEIKETISPEVQKKLDALDDKYDQGEMALKDYNRERDTINREIVRSQIVQQNALRGQKIWEKEQAHFLRNRSEYLEKSIKGNALFGALGEAIKTLEGDPKFSGLSGIELLVEADRQVKEVFGLGPKPKVKGEKVKEKEEVKPNAPLPDHKTLAGVPAAQKPEIGENWATQLDKLQGQAYEDALERLTPEQRSRYLDAR